MIEIDIISSVSSISLPIYNICFIYICLLSFGVGRLLYIAVRTGYDLTALLSIVQLFGLILIPEVDSSTVARPLTPSLSQSAEEDSVYVWT